MIKPQHKMGIMGRVRCACAILLVAAASRTTALPADKGEPKAAPQPAAGETSGVILIEKGELILGNSKEQPTLGNLIKCVRDLYPGANIVLAPGVSEIKIGDLKLSPGGEPGAMEAVLDALRVASGDAFLAEKRPPRPLTIDPQTGLPRHQESAPGEFFALLPDPNGGRPRADRGVEVFNMSGYLVGKDPAKAEQSLLELRQIVTDTVRDTAGSIDPQASMGPRIRGAGADFGFRFHPGASLLVVTGSPWEIEVARKVILALPDVTSSRVTSAQPKTKDLAPVLGDIQDLKQRAEFMRRYGLPSYTPDNPVYVPREKASDLTVPGKTTPALPERPLKR